MQMKHTRRRPTKSCLECNRRKKKCNREKPCNHCIEREVEHLCIYRELGPRLRASRSQLLDRDIDCRSRSTSDVDDPSDPEDKSHLEALDALEYRPQRPNRVLKEALNMPRPALAAPKQTPSTAMPILPSHLRESFPNRQVTDFLVEMFLREINRIHELIHPPSFTPKYNAWWKDFASNCGIDDESMDFGLLILRICVLSLQCLPHPNYPTVRVFDGSPQTLKRKLYSLANSMELPQNLARNRKRTLASIQHQYYHICYLKNNSQTRECWFLLGQTVNDAHSIGLHLEKPGHPIDGLEMELRRRTFWSLYISDRFMCTLLGRWPLIPEGHYDVQLPQDNLQAIITSPYHLTPFTDRIYHIKLAQFMQSSMCSFSWKQDQTNPYIIEKLSRKLEDDIVTHLPPSYRLSSPDISWDSAEPSIREKEIVPPAFIDPWNSLSRNQDPAPEKSQDGEAFELSLTHHRALIDAACEAISSATKLYEMTGPDECTAPERFFMLPVTLMESIACLGLCLLSNRLAGSKGVLDSATLSETYMIFLDAFALLKWQAQASDLAKRGVRTLDSLDVLLSAATPSPASDENAITSASSTGPTPGTIDLDDPKNLIRGHSRVPFGEGGSLDLPGWMPSFMKSPSSTWLLHESGGREITSINTHNDLELDI
ncbi:fungal-specific transcription factor domain-containing protein [Penicillium chermesinum]|nr:fungal-specific transcription factor domain-containing protein [Penicillium chermesinum]